MDSSSIKGSSLTRKSGSAAESSPGQVYRRYSAAERAQFFAVLDRAGSVAVAADAAGIKRSTGYLWAYKSGVIRPGPRKKSVLAGRGTLAERAEFLTVLARVGSISVAARELGLPRTRCAGWARAAGIKSIHPGAPKRAEFLRLREAGIGRKHAAATVGASHTSAAKWEHEWDVANGRAVPASAVIVPYKQDVTTSCTHSAALDTAAVAPSVSLPSASASASPPAPVAARRAHGGDLAATKELEALEHPIDSRYLSLEERQLIADMLINNESMRAISRELGRNVGTISREIGRNSHPRLGYQPHGAHRAATAARARPKNSKLAAAGNLRDYVTSKLRIRWSPEQISNVLIKDFPDDQAMRVSPETIYRGLYLQARGGLALEVKEALRTGRTRRKSRKDPLVRTSRFQDAMINISERPPEVEDRAIPGHYEGDLITGTKNQSAIGTVVERTTRHVMLIHLPIDHTAESVRDGLIKTMATLPAHLRGSLTWDQGAEMAKHKAFSIATDMDVYFCDPGSPWQRGTNENTNGLLRQYFPKGTDLSIYSAEDLEYVAQELNARPRKSLGWKTPAEAFRDLLIPN